FVAGIWGRWCRMALAANSGVRDRHRGEHAGSGPHHDHEMRVETQMKRFGIVLAFMLATMLLLPGFAGANSANTTYDYFMEAPNVSQASNGDRVAVTGEGMFSVNPKSASGEGSFTHTFAGGGSITGTWEATE